jgi:hypothetical protein
MDNTVDVEAPQISEEETVSVEETEGNADTQDETPVSVTFAGRSFPSLAEAERAYKELQKSATQAAQKLKAVEAQIKAEQTKAEFKNLDPDEKMDRLAELVLQRDLAQDEVVETEEALDEYDAAADYTAVQQYTSKHPVLAEYPELAEQFIELATTKYKEYTLDSLYNVKFKPLIEKLSGKKVVVKNKVVGNAKQANTFTAEAIRKMSPAEYEKHRDAILKSYGVN